MIIQAAGVFACAHRYVATAMAGGDRWIFACQHCERRTELLPLARDASFGQVLVFPTVGTELSAEGASGARPQSPWIQSA